MAHDRIRKNEFPLTQEFVAMMLGASRATVTVVAGTLQKVGLITYQRGRLTIVDRGKLESASCECYQTATNLLKNVTRPQHSTVASPIPFSRGSRYGGNSADIHEGQPP